MKNKNRFKSDRPPTVPTVRILAAVIIFLTLTVCFMAFFVTWADAGQRQEPDWSIGRGWNKGALKNLTYQCQSVKMPHVRTEYAAEMLLDLCFYDVLSGDWDKYSKRRYENELRRDRSNRR